MTAVQQSSPPLADNSSEAILKLGFWRQVYRHRLSLLSLLVALTSLGYNTWRNEATEDHRNIRAAGFQVLLQLGELEQIVSFRHYFYSRINTDNQPAQEDGDWRGARGWGKVALIRDLSKLIGDDAAQAAQALFRQWQQHAASLQLGPGSKVGARAKLQIDAALDRLRTKVLEKLFALS